MASVFMLAGLVVLLILALITLILFKVKSVWKLILKCKFAYFVTPSKVIQQFKETQEVCKQILIKQTLVVMTELRATPCRGRQDIAKWILINVTENALIFEGRFASCINVTFNKALPLPGSTCFGTTRVAQLIDPLLIRYIPKEQRSLVFISSVATWSLPQWASRNDELAKTLHEVRQLANSRAVAVANWTIEQVSARQSLSNESNKQIINHISTVSQGLHSHSVVALIIALVALVVAIATVVSVKPKLRVFWATMAAFLLRGPLQCAYTDRTEDAANQVKVVSALKGKHTRVEYHACQTRNQTLETLETQVTLILHISGMARFDYGPQQICEFTYGSVQRGLLITDVVKCTTTSCDCSLNKDIEVAVITLWPIAPLLSSTAEQVDSDATLTHS